MPIWFFITADLAVICFAVFLSFKQPHDPWRITPAPVVMLLLTMMIGVTVDMRVFLLTAGLVASFVIGRAMYWLRRSRASGQHRTDTSDRDPR